MHNIGRLTRRQVMGGLTGAAAAVTVGVRTSPVWAQDTIRVGFVLPDYNQLRWKNGDQVGFESEATKLGLRVSVVASQNSETVQASQVENLLTQGINVLVLTPVNGQAAAATVRKANSVSVPVVSYNFLAVNSDVAAFVGLDAVDMAKSMAQAAISSKPTGNYVLVLGDEGTSVAKDELVGFTAALKPHIESGAITIVSQQHNKSWSTDSARSQVENALTKTANDIAAVICGNDGMAYGAIQALQAQGLGGKVFVAGADAEPRAQELIRDGLLSLSAFPDFVKAGVAAAQLAAQLGAGQPVAGEGTVNNGLKDVPWVKIPHLNVTKENLAHTATDYPWWFDKNKLGL